MPRLLDNNEFYLFEDHLLRLDKDAKILRFKNGGADKLIPSYVQTIANRQEDKIIGKFHADGRIIGAVHISIIRDTAELGFSIEHGFRGQGLGRLLLQKGSELAKNMGAERIYTDCYVFNKAMIALAKAAGMSITKDGQDAEAIIHLSKMYVQERAVTTTLSHHLLKT